MVKTVRGSETRALTQRIVRRLGAYETARSDALRDGTRSQDWKAEQLEELTTQAYADCVGLVQQLWGTLEVSPSRARSLVGGTTWNELEHFTAALEVARDEAAVTGIDPAQAQHYALRAASIIERAETPADFLLAYKNASRLEKYAIQDYFSATKPSQSIYDEWRPVFRQLDQDRRKRVETNAVRSATTNLRAFVVEGLDPALEALHLVADALGKVDGAKVFEWTKACIKRDVDVVAAPNPDGSLPSWGIEFERVSVGGIADWHAPAMVFGAQELKPFDGIQRLEG